MDTSYNLLGDRFSRLRISELKEMLKEHKLPLSGNRLELIGRLLDKGIEPPKVPPLEDSFSHEEDIDLRVCTYHETYCRPQLYVDVYPALFSQDTSMRLYKHILAYFELPEKLSRRHTKTYGDDGLIYRVKFGGYGDRPEVIVEREAMKWDTIPYLPYLRDIIQRVTGSIFTYCVIQFYPSGRIGISKHKDKEMTPGSIIVGLSLGETRFLKLESYHFPEPLLITIGPGSVYVLHHPTNQECLHSIPKNDTLHPRISLTFRTLVRITR